MPSTNDENRVDATPNRSKVLVVHGRDERARTAVFEFLRAVKLEPLEWSKMVYLTGVGAPFVGEVLRAGFEAAQAVVVILTGDDKARLRRRFLKDSDPKHEREETPQPRPNVLFEAGMAMASHADRTILVQIGKIRPFSDIVGRHLVIMDNKAENRHKLAQRLESAGCCVDRTGTDWLNAGDFEYKLSSKKRDRQARAAKK